MNMLKMILSMAIFGTVGIVVNYIDMSPTMIVALRALIGAFVIAVVMMLRRKSVKSAAILQNIWWLLLSGVCLSANWILLFTSYDYTGSVAVSTVCYYMAPVVIMLLSPLLLKERMSGLRLLCVIAATVGVVLISGLTTGSFGQFKGILLALGAAVLYAMIVLINKVMKGLPAQESAFCQLAIAGVLTLPFALFVEGEAIVITAVSIVPMLILGVVHTGVAYILFFGAASKLPAQTTALLSYLDPLLAVLLSVWHLRQTMDTFQIIGTVLILGAALIGEVFGNKKKRRR